MQDEFLHLNVILHCWHVLEAWHWVFCYTQRTDHASDKFIQKNVFNVQGLTCKMAGTICEPFPCYRGLCWGNTVNQFRCKPAVYRHRWNIKISTSSYFIWVWTVCSLREGCKLRALENSVLRSWLQENGRNCIMRSFIIICKGNGHLGDRYY
jgi:hypothetical protein